MARARYPAAMRLARVLGALGRTFITGGVLILLFVVYQLWGTGLREAQAQNRLEDEFEETLGALRRSTTSDPGAPTTTTIPELPADGDAVVRLVIPAIGVDEIVVEGVTLSDLKRGPGHYPQTPLPGQEGNAAIAGHRTTYGAPFGRIDELKPGDEIRVRTVQRTFLYEVAALPHVVEPTAFEVLDDKGDDRLTLTACHPKYSARQRIIAVATLADEPVVAPARVKDEGFYRDPSTFDAGPGGAKAGNWPAIWLGVGCAAIWLVAWLVGRRWKKWPAYAIASPFFFVMLFFFFENFARLLPSNF